MFNEDDYKAIDELNQELSTLLIKTIAEFAEKNKDKEKYHEWGIESALVNVDYWLLDALHQMGYPKESLIDTAQERMECSIKYINGTIFKMN